MTQGEKIMTIDEKVDKTATLIVDLASCLINQIGMYNYEHILNQVKEIIGDEQ